MLKIEYHHIPLYSGMFSESDFTKIIQSICLPKLQNIAGNWFGKAQSKGFRREFYPYESLNYRFILPKILIGNTESQTLK